MGDYPSAVLLFKGFDCEGLELPGINQLLGCSVGDYDLARDESNY